MTPDFAEPTEDAIPLFLIKSSQADDALEALDDAARTWVKLHGFTGKLGQIALVPDGEGNISEALFGWGAAKDPPNAVSPSATLPRRPPKASMKFRLTYAKMRRKKPRSAGCFQLIVTPITRMRPIKKRS